MIRIAPLLLGLVSGVIEVELTVDSEVAAVVLELDGAAVERLSGSPWRARVDLGPEILPHRLTAVALDGAGRELGRTSHDYNLYRPPAGVEYVLHRNSKGWLTMLELSWPARAGAAPGRFAVSVDGRAVEADDRTQIWLPPLDPASFHLIEAVVEYSDGSVARDWLGFGGPTLGDDCTPVTPIQAEVSDDRAVARVAGGGEPPRVVAVERGDVELIVVRDAAAARGVGRFLPRRSVSGALSGARDAKTAREIHSVKLAPHEWVSLVDSSRPRSARARLDPHALEPRSTSAQPGDFGLFWHLRAQLPDSGETAAWTSDAVALAGARVATGRRPAGVVVVLSGSSEDAGSALEPDAAMRYLDAVGVPLAVWYLGKAEQAPPTWGEPVEVRSLGDLEKALDALRGSLERRAVVWVEGRHLPGQVTVGAPSG